jgi:perosamine synthetase
MNISIKLAIEGGKPIRLQPIRPVVKTSNECKNKINEFLEKGILSNWYGGDISHEFETKMAKYFGMNAGVASNSGTSALHLAYIAVGIKKGDEIIIPSVGYVSAASAAIQEGALPIICDVEAQTLGMCPVDLEKRISKNTKLIVPVHMWGIPNQMDEIMKIANKYNIMVLEDCGQAHGAKYREQLVGSFGDITVFSFAPRKHISTGQGGMTIFRNQEQAKKAKSAANKGKGHGWHDYFNLGYSYVMPDIEALIGLDGLLDLENEVERRRKAANIYEQYLKGTGLELQEIPEDRYSCYFKYPFRLPNEYLSYKEFMIGALLAENISTRASHPPMHTISWLADYIKQNSTDKPEASFPRPVAEREAERIIEVETGPGMCEEDVHISAKGVLKVWGRIKNMHKDRYIPEVNTETDVCT